MQSVVITMGGVDITNNVYSSTTGVIAITSGVTGNIIITAYATEKAVAVVLKKYKVSTNTLFITSATDVQNYYTGSFAPSFYGTSGNWTPVNGITISAPADITLAPFKYKMSTAANGYIDWITSYSYYGYTVCYERYNISATALAAAAKTYVDDYVDGVYQNGDYEFTSETGRPVIYYYTDESISEGGGDAGGGTTTTKAMKKYTFLPHEVSPYQTTGSISFPYTGRVYNSI
jgi:hypothetical protein